MEEQQLIPYEADRVMRNGYASGVVHVLAHSPDVARSQLQMGALARAITPRLHERIPTDNPTLLMMVFSQAFGTAYRNTVQLFDAQPDLLAEMRALPRPEWERRVQAMAITCFRSRQRDRAERDSEALSQEEEPDTATWVQCPYCHTTHSKDAVQWCKQRYGGNKP